MKSIYTTAEMARILEVDESTIKRWADQQHLECVKTKGGHRRFPIRSVLKFIHEHQLSLKSFDPRLLRDDGLREDLLAGDLETLLPEMRTAIRSGSVQNVLRVMRLGLAARPDLLQLCHRLVFPPLAEIGREWERGEATVDEEHLASQAVKGALQLLGVELFHKPWNGKTALLAAYENDMHDIPLRCLDQYLMCEGWRTLFLGAQTPVSCLIFSINRNKPNLVILSARVMCDESAFVRCINEEVLVAARQVGARIAVGGPDVVRRFGPSLQADYMTDAITDYAAISASELFEPA